MVSELEVSSSNSIKHDLLKKIIAYLYPTFELKRAAREVEC
jgi:hypothetical protein